MAYDETRRNGNPYYLQALLHYANNLARAEYGYKGRMFRINRNGRLALTPQFIGMIGYRTSLSIKAMVLSVARREAIVGVANQVNALAAILESEVVEDVRKRRTANEKLANAMRDRLDITYARSVEGRKQVPSYRIGRGRYSGGALRRALRAPDMIVATDDGINYINQDRLGQEARHWARLNFGVAPASTPASYRGTLKFGGKSIGTVGFRAQPRPPMFLPAGFWNFVEGKIGGFAAPRVPKQPARKMEGVKTSSTEELTHTRSYRGAYHGSYNKEYPNLVAGTVSATKGRRRNKWGGGGSFTKSGIRYSRDAFYPLAGGARYPTRGIIGANYLDGGLRALVQEFPHVYDDLLVGMIQDAEGKRFPGGHAGTTAANLIRAKVEIDPSGFVSKVYVHRTGGDAAGTYGTGYPGQGLNYTGLWSAGPGYLNGKMTGSTFAPYRNRKKKKPPAP